jgi:SAM-dependent methyltransferase
MPAWWAAGWGDERMTSDTPQRNAQERTRLRATFDQAAQLYDGARPGYPEALFEDVVSLSGIPPGGRILEIGCGTGQATVPFARWGYRILCVELGENLAAVARDKLAAYPQVEVRTGAFEETPIEADAFDLAIAATAFHWIDPAIAYPKTARALRASGGNGCPPGPPPGGGRPVVSPCQPGGAIALFWNQHVQSGADRGFFEAVQEVYRREAPQLIRGDGLPPRPHQVQEPEKDEIEKTGLFGEVTVRRYAWDIAYDATSYIDVLNTYSNHRDLDRPARERLFRGIAEMIDTEFHGRIVKEYLTLLCVAHRR